MGSAEIWNGHSPWILVFSLGVVHEIFSWVECNMAESTDVSLYALFFCSICRLYIHCKGIAFLCGHNLLQYVFAHLTSYPLKIFSGRTGEGKHVATWLLPSVLMASVAEGWFPDQSFAPPSKNLLHLFLLLGFTFLDTLNALEHNSQAKTQTSLAT